MSNFVIVSYFTLDTLYQDISHKYLLPSLERLGMGADIRAVENLGSWQKNTSYKPSFIKIMMEHHKDKNIVFVDVDAEILEYPKIFDEIPENYNIACHILDKDKWYNINFGEEKELLSGTIFIRNNEETKKIVDKWIEKCGSSNIWEQKVLQQIIKENNINIYELPIEYCYIKELPDGREPFIKCNPIILHHQLSRKLKHKIR